MQDIRDRDSASANPALNIVAKSLEVDLEKAEIAKSVSFTLLDVMSSYFFLYLYNFLQPRYPYFESLFYYRISLAQFFNDPDFKAILNTTFKTQQLEDIFVKMNLPELKRTVFYSHGDRTSITNYSVVKNLIAALFPKPTRQH